MKYYGKISPHAQALHLQRTHAPCLKFGLNGEDGQQGRCPKFSDGFPLEQNPTFSVDTEKDEHSLIYAVDDEPRILDLYTILLEGRGYRVRAFDNRIQALAELRGNRRKPDLLITDYFGHAMSVDGFTHQCRLAHPCLRILVASGFSQLDARFACVRPDRFIQKPFTAEEFLREVQKALTV